MPYATNWIGQQLLKSLCLVQTLLFETREGSFIYFVNGAIWEMIFRMIPLISHNLLFV